MAYHIISIGISKYRGPSPRNLQYAHEDAKELYYLFQNNVADTGCHTLLIDSEATLAAIRSALGVEIEEAARSEDTFLFFFSGHGVVEKSLDEAGYSNYLVPFDATADFASTCISVEYLKDRFSKIRCKNKLIIVDSCFSGSINSKSCKKANLKSLPSIKTFENTISGKGHVTFTASKEDEEAIEDLELQHGLFTYFFLEELKKESYGERIPILAIQEPVTRNVMERAKDVHSHDQTPTLSGEVQGVVYIPVFKEKLVITPAEIEIPTHRELREARAPLVELNIGDEKLSEEMTRLMELVVEGLSPIEQAQKDVALKKTLVASMRNLRLTYEEMFKVFGNDVSKIPESLARLEAESFHIQLIGCAIATFGNQRQVANYAERVGEVLWFGKGRSGLVALIDMPAIIVVNSIYSIGVICLANDNLELFSTLLKTRIYDPDRPRYQELYKYYRIHYCSSLGGAATDVGDHVRSVLENSPWLVELCPQLDGKIVDYQLQVNFLLSALSYSHHVPFYPDYGRFYHYRVMPLLARIRDDDGFRTRIASFLGKDEAEVIDFLKNYLDNTAEDGQRFFWNSVNSSVFSEKPDFI